MGRVTREQIQFLIDKAENDTLNQSVKVGRECFDWSIEIRQDGVYLHPVMSDGELPEFKLSDLPEIQSAILAEREACAKIVEMYWESGPALPPTKDEIVNLAASRLARQIRARSDPETPEYIQWKGRLIHDPIAPEIENKAPESPENLQASTYPASILKTCT